VSVECGNVFCSIDNQNTNVSSLLPSVLEGMNAYDWPVSANFVSFQNTNNLCLTPSYMDALNVSPLTNKTGGLCFSLPADFKCLKSGNQVPCPSQFNVFGFCITDIRKNWLFGPCRCADPNVNITSAVPTSSPSSESPSASPSTIAPSTSTPTVPRYPMTRITWLEVDLKRAALSSIQLIQNESELYMDDLHFALGIRCHIFNVMKALLEENSKDTVVDPSIYFPNGNFSVLDFIPWLQVNTCIIDVDSVRCNISFAFLHRNLPRAPTRSPTSAPEDISVSGEFLLDDILIRIRNDETAPAFSNYFMARSNFWSISGESNQIEGTGTQVWNSGINLPFGALSGDWKIGDILYESGELFETFHDFDLSECPNLTMYLRPGEPAKNDTNADNSSQTGKIVASVAGSFFALLLVCLFSIYCLRFRRDTKTDLDKVSMLKLRVPVVGPVHEKPKINKDFESLVIDERELDLEGVIGHGASGRIFKATYSNSEVAVKELFPDLVYCEEDSSQVEGDPKDQIWKELTSLQMLRHPNIIQLYGCTYSLSSDTGQWRLLVVMGLACCSLREVIDGTAEGIDSQFDRENLDLITKINLLKQVSSGMAYIHDCNVVHFDLKPENILLTKSGQAKLCDFGISKKYSQPNHVTVNKTMSFVRGTPPYMAPEILEGGNSDQIGSKSDVYSFGVVLWQLFHMRDYPYPPAWTVGKLFLNVTKNNVRPTISDTLNPQLAELIRLCWHRDMGVRPKFHEILKELDSMLKKEETIQTKLTRHTSIHPPVGNRYVWDHLQRKYSLCTISATEVDSQGNEWFEVAHLQPMIILDKCLKVTSEESASVDVRVPSLFVQGANFALESSQMKLNGTYFNSIGTLAVGYLQQVLGENRSRSLGTRETLRYWMQKSNELKANSPSMKFCFSRRKVNFPINMPLNNFTFVNFEATETAVEGSFSSFSGVYVPTLRLVSVRRLCLSSLPEQELMDTLEAVWNHMSHIFDFKKSTSPTFKELEYALGVPREIACFHGAYIDPAEMALVLVTEFNDGGSLKHVLDFRADYCIKYPQMSPADIMYATTCAIWDQQLLFRIAKTVLIVLEFLHNKRKLVHGNINPSQVFLHTSGDIKLSCNTIFAKISQDYSMSDFYKSYLSPEQLEGVAPSYASDIWSFGMVMLTTVMGHFPFNPNGLTGDAFMMHLKQSVFTSDVYLPEEVNFPCPVDNGSLSAAIELPDSFCDFVSGCLRLNSRKRSTVDQLLKHPWMQSFKDQPQHPEASIKERDVLVENVVSDMACELLKCATSSFGVRKYLAMNAPSNTLVVPSENLNTISKQLSIKREIVKNALVYNAREAGMEESEVMSDISVDYSDIVLQSV